MTTPSILEEIRRIRHAVSQRIGHDPHRIAAYYAELQHLHRDRIVNLSGDSSSESQVNRDGEDESSISISSSPTVR